MKKDYIAVGIDLGTTNTVLAILDKGAPEPRVVETRDGSLQMPSIVGVRRQKKSKKNKEQQPAEIVVGLNAAQNMETAAPEDTIYSVKRLMGRSYSDPNVADVRARVGYEILPPSDGTTASVNVRLDGREYSPVAISEMILRQIKADAEHTLPGNPKITHAVITVPTYFNADQRQATRDAGRQAGLQVMRILDEPVAAAYAYKLPIDGIETKNVLVFDFGGGTFDVSILSGQASQFVVFGRGGDMWLGGDDLDHALETAILDQLMDPEGDHRLPSKPNAKAMLRLRREARGAKERLVSQSAIQISFGEDLKDDQGEAISLEITRPMLERVIAPLVYSFRVCAARAASHRDTPIGMIDVAPSGKKEKDLVHWSRLHLPDEKDCATCGASLADAPVRDGKARSLVRAALAEKGMKPAFVDFVIMAGNSTRIPLVQRAMEEDFGAEKILRISNPKHSVALGAAKVAASMSHLVCDLGHVNEFGAVTCHECSAALGPASALPPPPPVTASFHYGVVWPGRPFQVFVPKGAVCPTPAKEIKERSFPTAVASQRMMTLPIFARDKPDGPKYDESQYKGLAVLPRGLPQGTGVKLKLWLDGSGTVCLTAGIAKNGGQKDDLPLKPFRLQGGPESKLVQELESLGDKMAARLLFLRDRVKELKSEMDDIFDLAAEGQFEKAAARVSELGESLEVQEVEKSMSSREVAMSAVGFVATIILDRLAFLIPEKTIAKFKRFVVILAEALESGAPPPKGAMQALQALMEEIPPPLMRLVNAEITVRLMRTDRPADARNLEEELGAALNALRLGKPGADETVSEIVDRILSESQQSPANVTCPDGHAVLVRYCVGPDHWDSWSPGLSSSSD